MSYLTAGSNELPAFLVIGTKRGGSTSLYEYLIRHPDVAPCLLKKGSHYFDVNHGRGYRYFRASFPRPRPGRITGEASPYYLFHPHAIRWIAETLPEVRLIAALRDPVERAYSHWSYETRRGFETLPFTDALDAEPERLAGEEDRMLADPGYESFEHRHHTYLSRGRYAEQLERVYALVPPERVHILASESMYADPDAALARAWAFLGLAPHRLGQTTAYKAGSYAPMDATVRERLTGYYREPNAALAALPGGALPWAVPAAEEAGDVR